LNLLTPEVNLELDVYEQRAKHLRKLLNQRKELIQAASGEGLDDLIAEITEKPETEPDF
jgi:hypothetical protein